jgi:hypothetical protein
MNSGNEGPLPEFNMGKGEIRGLSSKEPLERFEAEEKKRLLDAYFATRPSAEVDGIPIQSITRAAHCLNEGVGARRDHLSFLTYTRIYWGCQQSTSYSGRGTFPVRRVQTTQYATIHYYIELPSLLAPAKITARHIVECPGCMNILSFDLTPAYETDKNKKYSLWSFLSAIIQSKPRCILTHGNRFDKGWRRPNESGNVYSVMDDLYSDALYFHKFLSLELDAIGSIREKGLGFGKE